MASVVVPKLFEHKKRAHPIHPFFTVGWPSCSVVDISITESKAVCLGCLFAEVTNLPFY